MHDVRLMSCKNLISIVRGTMLMVPCKQDNTLAVVLAYNLEHVQTTTEVKENLSLLGLT
jgi:hypothetical protein